MSTYAGGSLRRGPMGGNNYTTIHRGVFRDSRLSPKAMGIFGHLSTHTDGWQVTERSIAASMRSGVDAIRTGLRELEEHGYLIRTRVRDSRGVLRESDWYFTDLPAQLVATGTTDPDLIAARVSEEFDGWLNSSSQPTTENPTLVATSENNTRSTVKPWSRRGAEGEDEPTVDQPTLDDPTLENPPYKERIEKEIILEGTNPPPPPPRSSPEPESDQETDGGGGGADPFNETLDDIFRAFVLELPWDRKPTAGQLDRLSRMVQDALNPGWTLGTLRRELVAELDGVRSRYAIWQSRLSRLPEEPLEVTRGVPVAGASSGALPPPCGQCDARYNTDPASARVVWTGDGPSDYAPCPRCHPSMINNNQEDQS